MIVSMTGYGQAKIENELYRISVEIKSINHRFSEITVRMPRQFLFLEDKLKKQISRYVSRGKVDVFITVEGEGLVEKFLQVDWDLLREYHKIHRDACTLFKVSEPLTIEKLLLLPDVASVIEKETKNETVAMNIMEATEKAAEELFQMRQNEGKTLAVDFQKRIHLLMNITNAISIHAPKVVEQYQQRLTKRMEDYLNGKLEIDETRLLTEVALFAEKANIDEELTRLNSHFQQFLTIIDQSQGACGRKLDFLVQEMNREANTIGSKSNDLNINRQVVELKAELEKIKEQVQNIE